MFVGILRVLYYERLVRNTIKIFANIVILGEIIENTIKSDKISIEEVFASIKKIAKKGKEREVNVVGENCARFNQSLHPAQPMYFLSTLNTGLTPYSTAL